MDKFIGLLAIAGVSLLSACSSAEGGSSSSGGAGGGSSASSSSSGSGSSSSSSGAGGASSGAGGSGGAGSGSGGAGGSAAGPPTAADLLALLASCKELTASKYQSDDEPNAPADIPVCGLTGAVYWNADMDIDCDGKMSAQCNDQTDPSYLPETAATDSNGEFLDAATLPYVVVPLKSFRFDYKAAGLTLGSVIAVIYKGKVEYGVFGDLGPANIIGEASYAMAKSLGIDPDPAVGGADSGVTYIAFTGATAVVGTMEDHNEAVQVGQSRAAQLLTEN